MFEDANPKTTSRIDDVVTQTVLMIGEAMTEAMSIIDDSAPRAVSTICENGQLWFPASFGPPSAEWVPASSGHQSFGWIPALFGPPYDGLIMATFKDVVSTISPDIEFDVENKEIFPNVFPTKHTLSPSMVSPTMAFLPGEEEKVEDKMEEFDNLMSAAIGCAKKMYSDLLINRENTK
jgi:hypothetical protein